MASDGLAQEDAGAHPQVFWMSTPGGCTASLIASNVILTAAHCNAVVDGPITTDELVPYVPSGQPVTINPAFNAPPGVATQVAPVVRFRSGGSPR